ncbi:MAG: type VI secretion system baseplate subunit TssG [Pirellulaceae bacterium]
MTDFATSPFDAANYHCAVPPLTGDLAHGAPIPGQPGSVERDLFLAPGRFDFFQAVSLLERLGTTTAFCNRTASARHETVRFRTTVGSVFPPSAISRLRPSSEQHNPPFMTVAFFGLTGPSGILPRHYTELIARIERESKSGEKHALRDWLDLFNHRLLWLFYRGWAKYRTGVAYARGEYTLPVPDTFTEAVLASMGLGLPSLRNRLKVSRIEQETFSRTETVLGEIRDQALIRYSGLLAQRPRTAVNLQQLLHDYFGLPITIEQFAGQWLVLEPENRSTLGRLGGENQLGVSAIAGDRIWDRRSKIRVRIGPLDEQQFSQFLPDRTAGASSAAFFLLCHLTRLYLGPELDFCVQLVLRKADVPSCRLAGEEALGARLGWNSWLHGAAPPCDVDDAVFEEVDARWFEADD